MSRSLSLYKIKKMLLGLSWRVMIESKITSGNLILSPRSMRAATRLIVISSSLSKWFKTQSTAILKIFWVLTSTKNLSSPTVIFWILLRVIRIVSYSRTKTRTRKNSTLRLKNFQFSRRSPLHWDPSVSKISI